MHYIVAASSFIEVLQSIFQLLFDNIFSPILTELLQIAFEWLGNLIWTLFADVFLDIFTTLLSLVRFLNHVFGIFAGMDDVSYNGQSMSLLSAFFRMNVVTKAMWIITLSAVGIALLLTIYATGKSVADMTLEDKNPISKVFGGAMKSAATFMLVPFLCIMMLELTSVVTQQVTGAFSIVYGGKTVSIDDVIFVTAANEAAKGSSESEKDALLKSYQTGTKHYYSLAGVRGDFEIKKINFLVGIVCSVLMIIVLAFASLLFVRRIFELLLLYLVSPYFVSTMVLDDGAMFGKWRDMFVAKFLSGFGIVFTMQYYMLIVPTIISSNFVLYVGNKNIDSILKIIFILGGAWAVYQGQHLALQILNPQAAEAAQQSAMLVAGMATGGAMSAVRMAGMIGGRGGQSKNKGK